MSQESFVYPPSRPHAIYDKLFLGSNSKRQSRFLQVKRSQLRDLVKLRPNITNAFKIAVDRWYKSTCEELQLFYILNQCHKSGIKRPEKQSHNVFAWSYREFLDRRLLRDCVWVDVLIRDNTEQCLDKLKFRVDMVHVMKYIQLIYKIVLRNVVKRCKVDLNEKLWRPLRNAERFFNIVDYQKDIKSNIEKKLQKLKNRLTLFDTTKCMMRQSKHILELEEMASNMEIWIPTKSRYVDNWIKGIVNQKQLKVDCMKHRMTTDINFFKTKTLNEKVCVSGILSAYYTDCNEYKRGITDLQERFEKESDELQNNLTYMHAQIEKLRETKRNLAKEIERFHFEIERRLALEAKWFAEAEAIRLENEAKQAAIVAEFMQQQKMQEKKLKKAAAAMAKKKR